MKPVSDIQCDLLVIGAGIAGMVATTRAAQLGIKTVQAGNSSGLFLNSGLFDFLGVYPLETGCLIDNPYAGRKKLIEKNIQHPYAKVSEQTLTQSFDYVCQSLSSADLGYQNLKGRNAKILTAAGTFKPSFLVPGTMLNGCGFLEKKKRVLLADFKGLKGFSSQLIADTLIKKGGDATAITIDVPQLTGDFNVTRLARLFEDPVFVEYVSKKILPVSKDRDLLGLPGVCGINNCMNIMASLEKQTGLHCFEIPGLPPSIPGLRLKNAFENQISKNHAIVLNNSFVQFKEFEQDHMILSANYDGQDVRIKTRGAILATGRFPGGGLHAKRGLIQETVFHIPVYQPRQRKLWYEMDLFSSKGHAINQAGILTDENFRPVDEKNVRLFETLYACGSNLAYNDWVRLKSGAGVSCVTAFSAVNHFHKGLEK